MDAVPLQHAGVSVEGDLRTGRAGGGALVESGAAASDAAPERGGGCGQYTLEAQLCARCMTSTLRGGVLAAEWLCLRVVGWRAFSQLAAEMDQQLSEGVAAAFEDGVMRT